MTAPSEQDPARNIVDIDTFALYINGYVRAALEAPPTRSISPESEDPEMIKQIHDTLEEMAPGVGGRVFLDPRTKRAALSTIYVKGCPWEEIPESIQQVIALGYDATQLDEPKTVDIEIGSTDITFALNAPSIQHPPDKYEHIDAYGENYTLGVELTYSREPGPHGYNRRMWMIDKQPVAEVDRIFLETTTERERQGLFDREVDRMQQFPVTLKQLQDIARLLHASRRRIVTYGKIIKPQ